MIPTSRPSQRLATPVALAAALAAALAGCASTGAPSAAAFDAPELKARAKPILTAADGTRYKDLNGNGRLDVYEDWRRPIDQRVDDLVAQMTLEEKAGLMLIDTLNGGCGGAAPEKAADFVNTQKMHRFIFRNVVNAVGTCGPDRGFRAGSQLTPEQAAKYTNTMQQMTEATRLGIPALFKSNARNHFERDARVGINNSSGVMTEFPKESGLAAAALGDEFLKTGKATVGDMASIKLFAHVMGEEWKAIGLRGMYGYMAEIGRAHV
jgi:beta-glucosidase